MLKRQSPLSVWVPAKAGLIFSETQLQSGNPDQAVAQRRVRPVQHRGPAKGPHNRARNGISPARRRAANLG